MSTHLIGNDAFQEVDIVGMLRNTCKYAVTVRDRKKLGEIIKKAFYIAQTGKLGVVLVDLPKDIQRSMGSDDYPDSIEIRGYKPTKRVHSGQLAKALAALESAKYSLFLLGGGVNIARANEVMRCLAEKANVPVVTTIMGKGAIPTNHPLYIGNIGIHGTYVATNTAIANADLLFCISRPYYRKNRALCA